MIVNMTPHPVVLLDEENKEIKSFPSAGKIRLAAETVEAGTLEGVRLTKTVFGEPEGLPETDGETMYIVSQIVKSALPDRADLLVPSEVVRDSDGRIIGCRSLGI